MRTADTLYLGASIPTGGIVTPDNFETFLRASVTPRYPGFTFWRAVGAWEATREDSYVLRIVHDGRKRDNVLVCAIAADYKRTFQQDAVLRETSAVNAQLV